MQTAVDGNPGRLERAVGFYENPVECFSRPVNTAESWAAYRFEMHARKCAFCHNPYDVYRNHEQLCEKGHGVAQEVARHIYQGSNGAIYSTTDEDNKPVRIEVPTGFVEVRSLLRAISSNLRHRSRKPFVSMDGFYYTVPKPAQEVSAGEAGPVRTEDGKFLHTINSTTYAVETIDWPLFTEDSAKNTIEQSSLPKPASMDTDSDLPDADAEELVNFQEATQHLDTTDSSNPVDYDLRDELSVASSEEGSVFSISSLASSATDLWKGSGYSAVQIATATRALLSIFRDDEFLQPLYTIAIHGAIGPRKFANTFRRLLKAFAERLKDEAQDRLDFLAALLVALKAREISEAILELYQLGKAPELDADEKRGDGAPEREDQDSSDEDEQETNVDETIFEELTNVREFLVQSAAFKLLQTDLQRFVLSKRQSKKQSKKPSNEREDEMALEGKADPINHIIAWDTLTSFRVPSMESTVEDDCLEILKHDRPLLQLHLHALDILGRNRFVIEYSKLLLCYYGNNRHCGALLIDRWIPVASNILLYLRIADANESYRKNQSSNAKVDTILFLDSWSEEERHLDSPTTLHSLGADLAFSTLRRPLRELLTQIPKRLIALSSENDSSFLNRSKAFLEDYTMAEWDWWPLAPRVPDVTSGECRLQWKFGGVQLYETLSSLEWDTIRLAMPSMPHHPKKCFCCHIERSAKNSSATSTRSPDGIPGPGVRQWCWILPMTWIKAAAGGASSPSNSSTARQRYTPTSSSTTSTPVAGGTSTNPSATNSSSPAPQVSGQPTTAPSTAIPDPTLRILFGVQGSRWSLEVEQINITAVLNDPAFFRELKTRYKKHRSWIKRLVSPFRFRFCRFVKLEKFDTGRVLSQGDDLPDHPGFESDYEYTPRPGTNPMISPKTFAVCLKACDMNCKWPWLNPWHDCVSLPCRSYRLGCIPKKRSEFDIQSDDAIAVAWGLEADYAISFAFMGVYHLVPLLAAFGFWIYWLIKFPGDWQNAAVPVLTVLAIFAVMWLPFGKHLGIV